MKEFKDFGSFAKHLEKISLAYDEKEHQSLIFLGIYLQNIAKDTIGHLQQGGGDFESWEPLAKSTIADKKRQGYVYNDEYNPLLRTGELRDSIDSGVEGHSLFVGSTDEIMVYQELGTKYIPPRSVLGLTMFKEKKKIAETLGNFMRFWITAMPITSGILK